MFISRPTEVLKAFLQQEQGLKPRMEFTLGRLSMALEIITVIKTLEDEIVPMLSLQRAEIVSVLHTLLRDQNLAESAMGWYEALTLWRQPAFSDEPASEHEGTADASRLLSRLADVASSQGGGLQHARALAEGTRALHDERQSPDPPSDVWDPTPDEAVEAMHSELYESLDDGEIGRAEFLRLQRSRRGIEQQRFLDRYGPLPETDDPSA